MKYNSIIKGEFIKRLNRFVALCRIDSEDIYCHVKNTGRCKEILVEGAECFLEVSSNPQRKYGYSLVTVKKGERLINIDSQAPNKAVGEFLKEGKLFSDISFIQPEKTYGNSRFDFYFEHGGKKAFLEVKGVTLEKDGAVFFPDAPTERGTKHLNELCDCIEQGYEAYAFFVVQMKNVKAFSPNDSTDFAFGKALRAAADKGVKIICYDCSVTENEMLIEAAVPVIL
ncbi:MAG: DNA/RNA nuclease SfsA [Ruminococcaceae bacterium]|nr:DNA/RNA nuclease SfsA [Oscillospiraceae bacterium]